MTAPSNSSIIIACLCGTIAVMSWHADKRKAEPFRPHPPSGPETFRGITVKQDPLTPAERADQLVKVIEMMRKAGWEPTVADVSIPEGWAPPEDWTPPEGWKPPKFWPGE